MQEALASAVKKAKKAGQAIDKLDRHIAKAGAAAPPTQTHVQLLAPGSQDYLQAVSLVGLAPSSHGNLQISRSVPTIATAE